MDGRDPFMSALSVSGLLLVAWVNVLGDMQKEG